MEAAVDHALVHHRGGEIGIPPRVGVGTRNARQDAGQPALAVVGPVPAAAREHHTPGDELGGLGSDCARLAGQRLLVGMIVEQPQAARCVIERRVGPLEQARGLSGHHLARTVAAENAERMLRIEIVVARAE